MRIAITGASGNVGTSLVEALAEDPEVESVLGIARRRPDWSPPKVRWVTADMAADPLREHFAGHDAVVHLAWAFHPMRRPVRTWELNVGGSARVFDAAVEAGVPTLVYASSVGAYSPGPKDRAVDERWPTGGWPTAAYAREKAYVERLLDGVEGANPDMRVVRLRPGFIFKRESASQQRRLFAGPLLPGRLVSPGSVPAVPDFAGLRFQALHSTDAAAAYRLALHRPVHGAFNLAADPVIDHTTLAELLDARSVRLPVGGVRAVLSLAHRLRAVPVEPALLDALVRVPIMDTGRARTELGWAPRYRGDEALAEMLAGMRAGAGHPAPPLHPATSGPARAHEVATGVGAGS